MFVDAGSDNVNAYRGQIKRVSPNEGRTSPIPGTSESKNSKCDSCGENICVEKIIILVKKVLEGLPSGLRRKVQEITKVLSMTCEMGL